MTIPSVGSQRGIFELFLPGLFLLLNLLVAGSLLSPDAVTSSIASRFAGSVGLSVLAAIPLGYCLGVALRLMRTSTADKCSGWTIRASSALFHRGSEIDFAIPKDRFPYPKGFKRRVEKNLPTAAMTFYEDIWDMQPGGASLSRFDFYKTILGNLSPSAATEIYAAEELCRYVANTLYSIAISFGFMLVALGWSMLHGVGIPFALLAPIVVYSIAAAVILRNFRYLRMYEVEIVFALAFRYRDKLARIIA